MKKTLAMLAAAGLVCASASAQSLGKPVALEVGKAGGPMLFVTTPPMGGLAATAKTITPREVFQIENMTGSAELKDGDSVRIHFVQSGSSQSTWVEMDEVIRRTEVRNAKPEISTFKVKSVGTAFVLQAPSGKFVTSQSTNKEGANSTDVRAFLTTPDEGEAMQITPHWDPQPQATPEKSPQATPKKP